MNSFSTSHSSNHTVHTFRNSHFHTSSFPSTDIRTNSHINTTSTQPFTPCTTVQNIPPNPSNIAKYHTKPPATIRSSTLSNPTYSNSSASSSESIKHLDGLDQNYTPEEYLQHIEARVTLSLGLQPTSDHEYKFWHGRRLEIIQCFLLWYSPQLVHSFV